MFYISSVNRTHHEVCKRYKIRARLKFSVNRESMTNTRYSKTNCYPILCEYPISLFFLMVYSLSYSLLVSYLLRDMLKYANMLKITAIIFAETCNAALGPYTPGKF